MPRRSSGPPRRGGALLVALALLALASAMLAGSAQAGRFASRSAQSHSAGITADAATRAAMAEFMVQWSASDDVLPIGQGRVTIVGPRRVGAGGMVSVTQLRLLRLSSARFMLAAESAVGPEGAIASRRRLCLIIERVPSADTTGVPAPPVPIGRWSISDLY